jgi:RHS repeat-associated protein
LQTRYYGNLISQRRGGTTSSYYFFDALGSTLQLTGSSGTVTDSYLYRAFGELINTSGSTTNAYRYGGRHGYSYDPDLANYHIRARRYDPTSGRWWSRDPLDFIAGDANLYRYSSNKAPNALDPSGLADEAPFNFAQMEQSACFNSSSNSLPPTSGPQGDDPSSLWGQDGGWWLNPFSYYPFRPLPNYLGGVYGKSDPPSTAASFVPVIGPLRQAASSFQNNSDVYGAVHLATACADVVPVNAIRRSIMRGTAWHFGNPVWDLAFDFTKKPPIIPGVRDWLGKKGFAMSRQPVHHVFLKQNTGLGKNCPLWLKNQTWNLMPVTNASHQLIHNGTIPQRLWYGYPTWFQTLPLCVSGRLAPDE